MPRNELLALAASLHRAKGGIYRWSERNVIEYAEKLASRRFTGSIEILDAANEILADKVTICYAFDKRDILNIAKTLLH
jgi:hypothetical protein